MRMFRTALVLAVSSTAFWVAACSGSSNTTDNDPYATYQACWDDHHNVESFDVQQSIVICCLDHPIGNQDMNVVCGATASDCETYVNANLTGSDLTSADITAACATYITQRTM